MPIIQGYDEHILAQGGIQARATPDDFGAQVGQGMQRVGGALGEAADVANKVAEDQGRIWAYDAASSAYMNLKQKLTEQTNALDPNDPNFTEKTGSLASSFESQVNDTKQQLMNAATTRSARRVVESHMTNYGHALINHGIAEQARITGEYTGKLVQDGVKSDEDAVAADTSNANYEMVLANRRENIGGLVTVDPALKVKWLDTMEHNLAKVQVSVLAATQPKDFLAIVHAQGGRVTPNGTVKGAVPGGAPEDQSGSLPQVQPLTDQDIAEAAPGISGWGKLNWQEKVAAVRQAEAAVGGALALDRGTLDRDLKDAQASLLAGKSYDGLDGPRFSQANMLRLYGPVDGPRKFDQLTYDRKVGGFISQMTSMPVGQAVNLLKAMEPAGGPEFADKNPVYQHALAGFQQLQANRSKDFMQWAQDNKVGNAKPVDFSSPDTFQKTIGARITVATAGATDYQADAHLLTKDETAQLGDMLTRLTPQDQMAYLKALRTGTANHDDWYQDTLAQIAPKNTMLAYSASVSMRNGEVTTAGGPQDGSTVGKYILEGAHILQGKDLGDPEKSGRPLHMDDGKIRKYFWETVGPNAFSSPDAQRSAQAANDTYQAVKNYLAADIYHRGINLDDLYKDAHFVANAVKAVTGGTVKMKNGDSLFVPWGMSADSFSDSFSLAVGAAITDAGLKGSKMDAPTAFHFSNVDEGRYVITIAGRSLLGSDGRPVIVDINKQGASPYLTPTNGPSYAAPVIKDRLDQHSLTALMGGRR